MDYIGEHSFIGYAGNFFVVLAFAGALMAAVSYWFSARSDELENLKGERSWKNMARTAWILHSMAVFGIIACLFIMLTHHYFEYDYIWKHSNKSMPLRYIFSCFWEGQEGSFLLWSFWHVVIGSLIAWKAKKWESRVMTVFAATQVFLSSMLLGIYLGDFQLGSNPFILIRELAQNIGLPWTQMPDYLTAIPTFADGRGLNPLLQNYWMTIHPPTLFLGFACALVPFSYVIAGLWKGDLKGWIKPAIPYVFIGVVTLGTGVLMGGAWAYEALSFGGFWAWDPVENASLVPWLTLVAAGHVMIITKNKAGATFSSALLVLITYVLIIYSTFLTRSGILGESSVHSFTGDGMLFQLTVGMFAYLFCSMHVLMRSKRLRLLHLSGAIVLGSGAWWMGHYGIFLSIYFAWVVGLLVTTYTTNWTDIKQEEEASLSREFWMFLGAVVLLLAAFHITIETSKPVAGALFDANWTLTTDVAKRTAKFHQFQIPFAIVLTVLMGISQYLKYKKTDPRKLLKNLAIPFLMALVLSLLLAWATGFSSNKIEYILLLFSASFAIFCNLDYWIRLLKGKIKRVGSPMAHVGFGLILLGALVSTSQSDKITRTHFDITQLDEKLNRNESILMLRDDTVALGPYFAVFNDKYKEDIYMHYQVEYFHTQPATYRAGELVYNDQGIWAANADHQTGTSFETDRSKWNFVENPNTSQMQKAQPWARAPGKKAFTLNPMVQMNDRFGNVPEPSTKHWWNKDLYTHVQYALLHDPNNPEDEWQEAEEHQLSLGDTLFPSGYKVILDTIQQITDPEKYHLDATDFAVLTRFNIYDGKQHKFVAEPLTVYDAAGNKKEHLETLDSIGLRFEMKDFNPYDQKVTVALQEKTRNFTDFMVMQAIIFPYINLLWIGCVLMVLGTILAIVERFRMNRRSTGT